MFNTVSDNLTGPFKPINIIGKGHNPEMFQAKDGRYVLYVIDGRYVADDINGKWAYHSTLSAIVPDSMEY